MALSWSHPQIKLLAPCLPPAPSDVQFPGPNGAFPTLKTRLAATLHPPPPTPLALSSATTTTTSFLATFPNWATSASRNFATTHNSASLVVDRRQRQLDEWTVIALVNKHNPGGTKPQSGQTHRALHTRLPTFESPALSRCARIAPASSAQKRKYDYTTRTQSDGRHPWRTTNPLCDEAAQHNHNHIHKPAGATEPEIRQRLRPSSSQPRKLPKPATCIRIHLPPHHARREPLRRGPQDPRLSPRSDPRRTRGCASSRGNHLPTTSGPPAVSHPRGQREDGEESLPCLSRCLSVCLSACLPASQSARLHAHNYPARSRFGTDTTIPPQKSSMRRTTR
ncbi:hypothetical protein VDGL01_09978 [Verticillium dahliae]